MARGSAPDDEFVVKALGMAEGWGRESRSVVLENFLGRCNTLVYSFQIGSP